MVPALIILLGVEVPTVVDTVLAAILATSSFSMLRRRGSKTVDLKLALIISAGSIIGVILGQRLLDALDNMPALVVMGRRQQAANYIVLWAFVVLLVWIAGYLAFDYKRSGGRRPGKRVGAFAKIKLWPVVQFGSLEEPELPVWPLVLMGLIVGVLTGLMGIGGVIMLPALVYLAGQRTVKAAGTSLVLVWVSSLTAVILNTKDGNIDMCLLLTLITGGVAGAYFGTHVGLKITGPKLRFYFIFVVIAAICGIGYKLALMTLGGAEA